MFSVKILTNLPEWRNIKTLDGLVDSQGNDFSMSLFAERVGVSRQALYDILDGSAIPRVNIAIKICNYLTELFGFQVSCEDLWYNAK